MTFFGALNILNKNIRSVVFAIKVLATHIPKKVSPLAKKTPYEIAKKKDATAMAS